jgi:peptidoglycan/xylan/chitin deacetylase (PgdA/CDA1 family)
MARYAILKRLLGRILAAPVLGALRRTGLRAGLAVYYHRVGDPQGDPRRELVPQMGTGLFSRQLRYMHRHFELVRASELLEAARSRRPGEPFPLAITFDDDLACHCRVAMPLLAAAGAPATFFLSGASLERPGWFWWEALDARGGDVLAEAQRILALDAESRGVATVALVQAAGAPPPDAGMRGEDVAALASAGHEIGFHTLRHSLLPALDDEALGEAMSEGREALERWAGGPLTAIAYPHGRCDDRVADAARRAGFASGFSSAESAVRPEQDPLSLGRLEGPFSSVGQLAFVLARTLLRAYRS